MQQGQPQRPSVLDMLVAAGMMATLRAILYAFTKAWPIGAGLLAGALVGAARTDNMDVRIAWEVAVPVMLAGMLAGGALKAYWRRKRSGMR